MSQEPAVADARRPSSDDRFAAAMRGFGPIGGLAMLVILAGIVVGPALSAVLVLVWAAWSRTPLREIGYARPRTWLGSLAIGLVFGAALKLLLKVVVMPLLGADPVNQAFHHLVGNRAALAGMVVLIVVGAGFGEETLFRGYLFERLGKLLGASPSAKAAIVIITALLFGAVHYPSQGLAGAEQGLIVGLVFGTTFAITGRIWMLMVAHVAFDLVAVAIIYWNLESDVAHLIFK